jgi:arylsulfatase A-like enzyme
MRAAASSASGLKTLALLGLCALHGCVSPPTVQLETTLDLLSLLGQNGCSRPREDREAQFVTSGETRSAIVAVPGQPLVFEALPVHEHAVLTFAAGRRDGAPAASARFAVTAEASGAEPLHWEATFTAGGWNEGRLDLGPFSGRNVRLRFEADGAGLPPRALGWATPRITSAGRPAPRSLARARNVVLVSIDTLRVDRTGAYGSSAGFTPHLDRLARSSQVWAEAYCPQTWTLTSHMSVFTGLYPEAHAVRNDIALAPGVHTLPQELSARGYRTAGFVDACFFLAGWYGFERGMELYLETREPGLERNRAAVAWAEQHAAEPMFLFVHYYDAHGSFERLPYGAPPPLERLYPPASEASEAELRDCFPPSFLRDAFLDGRPLVQNDLDYLGSMYASGVHAADAALGDLVDRLGELGILDEALLVVMSDHGEELLDHGGLLHEQPYEEVRRVACLLRFPAGDGRPARIQREPTMNVDLLPTILEWVGAPVPRGVEGISLLAPGLAAARPLRTLGISPLEAAWSGRYGLIYKQAHGYGRVARPEPTEELYDLDSDPGERRDLAPGRPALVERTRETLWERQLADRRASEMIREQARQERRAVSAEELERLRGLGYVNP